MMNGEKGREMWLAFIIISIAGLLAWGEFITGDQWIQLASWYGGGTTGGRILYKLIKNGDGSHIPKPSVLDTVKPDEK